MGASGTTSSSSSATAPTLEAAAARSRRPARSTPISTRSAIAATAIAGAIAIFRAPSKASTAKRARSSSRRCSTTTAAELIARHRIRYDYLVIAVGSVTNDFGIPGVRENCMVLDDRDGADRFRNRLLNHCLRVSRAMTARGRRRRARAHRHRRRRRDRGRAGRRAVQRGRGAAALRARGVRREPACRSP